MRRKNSPIQNNKRTYRTFTKKQIDQWIKDDKLPANLAKKTEKYWKELT